MTVKNVTVKRKRDSKEEKRNVTVKNVTVKRKRDSKEET